MSEVLDIIISDAAGLMKKAISHLETELSRIRAGKANTQILDGVYVDYYGASTQLSQVANITIPDARTLAIQPWEKSMMAPIEKAIIASNIGLNPQNDGTMIRLFLPPLTEERRKQLVKLTSEKVEEARIGLRAARQDALQEAKRQKDAKTLTEDDVKAIEKTIDGLVAQYQGKLDTAFKSKEQEILKV